MTAPNNLRLALEKAVKGVAELSPEVVALNSGCSYLQKEGILLVPWLGREYEVCLPGGDVPGAPPWLRVLVLHYLAQADGTPLANRWISFRELPGGGIYVDPFQRRALVPLVKVFGNRPCDLVKSALNLGGREDIQGDASIVLNALPLVPLKIVLWSGDEEFAASGNIMFDASAARYLPTEDLAVLAQNVSLALIKAGQNVEEDKNNSGEK